MEQRDSLKKSEGAQSYHVTLTAEEKTLAKDHARKRGVRMAVWLRHLVREAVGLPTLGGGR